MGFFTRNSIHSIILTLVSIMLFCVAEVKGQVTTNGGSGLALNYPTLAAAITALNPPTVITSPVIITLTGNETAPPGGYVINQLGGTAANTITLDGAGFTVTAGLQAAGSNSDAVFKLVGTDYVSILNFVIQENPGNTVTAAGVTNTMTEWGIGLFFATLTNGAQRNTIQNNTISLNRNYINSFGIYSNVRHSATVPGTLESITHVNGSNSNNAIYNNQISNVSVGILFVGAVTNFMDTGNDIGGSLATMGNTITNWGNTLPNSGAFCYVPASLIPGPPTLLASIVGIYTDNQKSLNISYNTVTSAVLGANTVELRGIYMNFTAPPTGINFANNITHNTVSISSASIIASTSSNSFFEGIRANGTGGLPNVTINIDDNTVQNCAISGPNSATSLIAIWHSVTCGVLSISNNIIRNNTSTAITGGFAGIRNSTDVISSIAILNNQVGNASGNAISFSAATSGPVYGISIIRGAATSLLSISGNNVQGISQAVPGSNHHYYIELAINCKSKEQTISNNKFTNLDANTTGNVYFIYNISVLPIGGIQTVNNNSIQTAFKKSASLANTSVYLHLSTTFADPTSTITHTNNNFSNITLTGTTKMDGWQLMNAVSTSKTCSNNIFSNWTCGTGDVVVMQINSGISTVSNNTISDISSNGGTITGIFMTNIPGTAIIKSNTISGLAGKATGTVAGIKSRNPNATISGNKIFNLSNTTPTPLPSGLVHGISVDNTVAGTVTLSNNYIGDLRSPNTNIVNPTDSYTVVGLNLNSTVSTTTINAYYNTVWLNASIVANLSFGSCAVFASVLPTVNLRNNIFVNKSVPKGVGMTVAYRRGTPSLPTYANASNNNLFYAGTPGTNNLIFYDGLNSIFDLKNYQLIVGPNRDKFSITEDPPFLSTVGSDSLFLHINTACLSTPTAIESGAAPIAGFTTDYDGDIRSGEAGYTGTDAAPDIGADEFNSQRVVVTASSGLAGPVSYPTLRAAFTRINDGTHKGAITIKLYCNTVETATAVLNASSGTSNYSSVLIYPMVNGLSIRSSVSTAGTSELIDLNGADNVTIDGRVNLVGGADLNIIHTGTDNSSRNIRFINSAQNNKIRYCKISGGCPSSGAGVIFFSTSASGTGNDNNTLEYCEFTNSGARPLNVIMSTGTNGRDNSNNTIANNTFYNFLNHGKASNGIYLEAYSSAWSITSNSFYENTSFAPTAAVDYYVIRINNPGGNNFTVSGNYIGGSVGLCGGTALTKTNSNTNAFYGIYFNVSSSLNSNIQGNTIRNFAWSNSGAADWTGIHIAAGAVNVGTVTGNIIGAATGTGSISITNGAASADVAGIRNMSSATGIISNNTIGSITTASALTNPTHFYGIIKGGGIGSVTISNNSIGSTTTAGSINASSATTGTVQRVYGISNTTNADITISGNTIANMTNAYAGTGVGATVGISFTGGTGTNIVSRNFIHSLFSTNQNCEIYGLRITSGAGTYSNNIITLGTGVAVGCNIYGINETSTSASNILFNTVYIGGAVAAGGNSTYALYNGGNTNTRNFRNNILFNTRSGTGTHYAIRLQGTAGLTIDYNDYWVTGTILGRINATDYATFPLWSAATGQDVNSLNLNPGFPGAGGTAVSGYMPSVVLSGVAIAAITTDYTSITRANPPTIGALESVIIATTTLSPSTVCAGSTLNVCFLSTGTFAAGNVFTAQLSDATGSFAAPLNLAPALTGNASGAQCINTVLIPAGTAAGANYKIRVVSSIPVYTNDAGKPLTIRQPPSLSTTQVDVSCSAPATGEINLTVTGGTAPYTYLWTASGTGVVPGGQSAIEDLTLLVAGIYTVVVTDANGCTATSSVTILVTTLPADPTLTATSPCVGQKPEFTAGNGSIYQFFFNGVSQGVPSATNTYTPASPLVAGNTICVRSLSPFIFDGNLTESLWGTPLATSAGGPNPSGFGAGNNIDAIYLKSEPDYLFGGIAGNLVNNSGNAVLLFIDCQPGGYNNLGGWVNRTNTPPLTNSMKNLNNGITFDAGFEPDYILGINQAFGDVFFDLYNMPGNSLNYLGSSNVSALLGFSANTGIGDYLHGFEFAIPLSALGSASGTIKVFAMITNNPANPDPTELSNQFLTRANAGESNYGNGAVTFGAAAPNPIDVPISNINCYSETCITIQAVAAPTANNVTVCFDGSSYSATASAPGASIVYYDAASGGNTIPAPTNAAVGVYTAWAAAVDSITLCISPSRTQVTLTINTRPYVNPVSNLRYCNGAVAAAVNFTSTPGGATINWTSSADVGFGTSGAGNIGAYTALNLTNSPILAEVNVTATLGGCASLPVTFYDTVFPTPVVNPLADLSYCNGEAAPAIYFSSPTSGDIVYNWTCLPVLNFGANGTDSIAFVPINLTNIPIVTTVTVADSTNGCTGPATTFTITINPSPEPVIVTDYCSVPGFIVLTAQPSGMASYLWRYRGIPAYYTDTIIVDQAGSYSVTVVNSYGCQGEAYLDLGTELVYDGNFTKFKADSITFFSEYINSQGYYDGFNLNSGLMFEEKYAVNVSAWSNQPQYPFFATPLNDGYHVFMHGRDHTNNATGPRNFMMINGSDGNIGNPPHYRIIWQDTVDVLYQRDYYFSAWAMNLTASDNARLQFEINGVAVGSILDLATSPKPGNEAQVNITNWSRFYNTTLWTPPNAGITKAIIKIVNRNPSPAGNDFGLDDISFGIMGSIPDASSASANGGGTVCAGDTIHFAAANLHGGTPPYIYSWTGPNMYSSPDQNPNIPNAQQVHAGLYSLVVTDANGCSSLPSTVSVKVTEYPVAPDAALVDRDTICAGDSGTIILSVTGGSGETVQWLTGSCTGTLIDTSFTTLTIPVPFVTTKYYARWKTACGVSTCDSVTVTVNPLPAAAGIITGTTPVCQGATGVVYTVPAIANASGYVWTLPAGASITAGANTPSITVSFNTTAVSGNITVYGTNACLNGTSSTFAVTVNPLPVAAGTITGTTPVCQGATGVVYTVPAIANASGYAWSLPAGASITAGANTNSITVSFNATAVSGIITVSGTNACGSGTVSPAYNVTVNPLPTTSTIWHQ